MENKNIYKLSASLICADMLNLGKEIDLINQSGCEYIHFDVMDGVFVPRFGLYPEILSFIRKRTNLPVDVHLMTVEPEKYIKVFVDAGASLIAVHVEACNQLHRTISEIRKFGIQAGVALNPATPLSILDYLLDEIDLVLLMAINPGIVGHKLIPKAFDKISELKQKLGAKYKNIIIEIDGGVSFDSAALMIESGANMLVCGSSTIFKPEIGVDIKTKELMSHLQLLGY
jgi:ribulose-phosphate 3-epimerase